MQETLPYEPENRGEHAFVRFRKTSIDTLEVARRIARALGCSPRDPCIGFAGMKDRHAVAEQWFSCPWRDDLPALLGTTESDELHVLEIARHPHKLRRGHVASNRFSIEISDVPPGGEERARAILERVTEMGVPNAFGPQRFGRDQDNAERARAWIKGEERPPRDRRMRELFESALQSEIFNQVLSERISASLFDRCLQGDLAQKHDTGGMFEVDDPEKEDSRVKKLEISPTGPMVGKKMRRPTRAAWELEESVLARLGLSENDVQRLGPGTRRLLRYPLKDATIRNIDETTYRIEFSLPSGAYATVLLDEIVKPEDGPFNRDLAVRSS